MGSLLSPSTYILRVTDRPLASSNKCPSHTFLRGIYVYVRKIDGSPGYLKKCDFRVTDFTNIRSWGS